MAIYSNSRIETYENCPLRYKYKYVERIKPEEEFETVEAFLGSRVHDAMEKLYSYVKMQKDFTLEDILTYYDKEWKKNWSEDVTIIRKEFTEDNYKKVGIKAITDYYNRYRPFNRERVLGIEKRILIHLKDDDGYRLQGYIDRLSETKDGFYEVHDYKTSGYLPPRKTFETDRQLALYQLGVQKEFDDVKRVDLIWHYMAFDKEFRSNRNKMQLNELQNELILTIDDIEKAKERDYFPPSVTKLCEWCEYQALCPRMKHLVKTREMTVNEYMKEPGVKLVNQYAKLSEAIAETERERDKLKEAIAAYAKKNEVEAIAGTDKKLTVKFSKKIKYPSTSDKEREELEALIRAAGKWDEVSGLNLSSLAKSIEGWDKKLADRIRKYQKMEECVSFYLGKLEREEE